MVPTWPHRVSDRRLLEEESFDESVTEEAVEEYSSTVHLRLLEF